MTWNQLKKAIENLTPEQRETTATVHLVGMNEYFGIRAFDITDETDVLDANHPVMITDNL
jgi:hypothetical protein